MLPAAKISPARRSAGPPFTTAKAQMEKMTASKKIRNGDMEKASNRN
jgi:hypothetical protein